MLRLLRRLVPTPRELRDGLLHLFLPDLCHSCGLTLEPEGHGFCARCRFELLDDPHPRCPRCAATVGPHACHDGHCPACRRAAFAFDAVWRLGCYDGRLRDLVLQLKSVSNEGTAAAAAGWWADRFGPRAQAHGLDAVVPVPLHWARYWYRGYNQCAALARGISGTLGLPLQLHWLYRARYTPSQTNLTGERRRRNLRDAFRVRPGAGVTGRRVLLIDDVLTTGTTAHEAARALKRAGATAVVVGVLARTVSSASHSPLLREFGPDGGS